MHLKSTLHFSQNNVLQFIIIDVLKNFVDKIVWGLKLSVPIPCYVCKSLLLLSSNVALTQKSLCVFEHLSKEGHLSGFRWHNCNGPQVRLTGAPQQCQMSRRANYFCPSTNQALSKYAKANHPLKMNCNGTHKLHGLLWDVVKIWAHELKLSDKSCSYKFWQHSKMKNRRYWRTFKICCNWAIASP